EEGKMRKKIRAIAGGRRHEVTQRPDFGVGSNGLVTVSDQRDVVLDHVGERSAIGMEGARVDEVSVAGEIGKLA
ncbi:hypothetical protein ACC689_36165, partial [Rhizobium ruizarguesonis]